MFKIAIRLERSFERKAGYPIPGEEETNYIASALDRVGEHPRKNRDVKPAVGTMSFGLLLRAGVKGSYHEAGKSAEEEEPGEEEEEEEEEARNAHTHIPHASFPSPSSCVWRFALFLRAPPPPPPSPDPLSLQSSLTYSPTPTFLLFPFDAGVTACVSVFAVSRSSTAATTPPPTKTGKNNGCRQTNARTVVINKYIIFLMDFLRIRQKVPLKRIRLKTRFYVTKRPVQTP